MSLITAELGPVFVAMLMGWSALWPLRSRLGMLGYHLSALPIGLLGWSMAGAFSTLVGRPFDAVATLVGAIILVAGCWAIAFVTGEREGDETPIPWKSYVAAAAVLGVLGLVLTVARFTVSNNDSLMSYWPHGVALQRTGMFTAGIMATRSVLIPSVTAAHVLFGSKWAFTIYTLLAANTALWIAALLLKGPLARTDRTVKLIAVGGALAFLILEPSFIFHSFFVHSHMFSALYLLMSLGCLWLAIPPAEGDEPQSYNNAFLIVAGLSAAGLTLSRPDGLAYVFVPVAVAIAALATPYLRSRNTVAFFAPLLFVVYTAYASVYLTAGVWAADKLDGVTAMGILGVLAASAFAPWILLKLDSLLPFRFDGERFLATLVLASAALLGTIYALRWEKASLALANASRNLFGGDGGYGYLWYSLVALLLISVLTGDALRRGSWTRSPFLSVLLFFILAGLVHGTSHPGRIGVGDSFNRVAFHAVPLMVFYVGAVVARILSAPIADAVAEAEGSSQR